jgi:Rieske Fe-S protein
LHKLCPDIPISMELVVNHALAHDPSQRFQRVSELVEAFAQVCKGIVSRPQSTQNNETSFLLDEPKSVYNLQNVPEEEVSIGGWQLTPPVVTGKLLSARASTGKNSVPTQATPAKSLPTPPDGWQILPPIVTGRVAAVRPSQQVPTAKPVAPSVVMPSTKFLQQPAQHDTVAGVREQIQAAPYKQEAQPAQPQPVIPPASDVDPMNTPTWWIQAPSLAPSPLATLQDAPQGFPNQGQKKSMEQNKQVLPSEPVMRIRPAKRSRTNVGRRRVIATLAAGSVVAAGALVAGKMNLAHLITPLTAHNTQGSTTASGQKKPTGNTGTGMPKGSTGTPKGGTNPGKTGTTPTGKVIGATNIPVNTSADIVNPADGKAGLLIHLPNGNFVAYERACTHEGVEVNYDTTTHTIICPAHGSVFDPLNKAAVLQGPALRPLALIAFRVNADGTITAG